jgi:hypothetical protein
VPRSKNKLELSTLLSISAFVACRKGETIEFINLIKGLEALNTTLFLLCLLQYVSIRKGHHQAKYVFKHIKGYRIFVNCRALNVF